MQAINNTFLDHENLKFWANLETNAWVTCSLGCPAAAGLVEGGQSADGGAEDPPPEHRHRVHPDQLPDVSSVAAP